LEALENLREKLRALGSYLLILKGALKKSFLVLLIDIE
jgi:hypothetical protein